MRRRKTRSMKNPYSVSQEEDLWNEYNEELLNMRESLFIDKWHDTCEILPDYDNVWFIADGKICVGMYEPEQKVFCMADGMGVELKDVRQWKYVGINKQIAKYPEEMQIIAVSVPGLPCLATGIFTDHCIDEATRDEVSAVILDWDMGILPYNKVSYWFALPELPMVILDPVGDAPLAVMPAPEVFVPNEAECPPCEEVVTCEVNPECEECAECADPEDTTPEQPMELGDRSMESEDVKSSIAKSKMAVSGSDDLNDDPIKKGTLTESVDYKRRFEKVQPWYRAAYPTDELGEDIDKNIAFESVLKGLKDGKDIYDILGVGDSIVRERVFNELSAIYDVDYDEIYDLWIDNASDSISFPYDTEEEKQVDETSKDKIGLKWIEDYKQGLLTLPELHRRLLVLFDGDYKTAVEWLADNWESKPIQEKKLKEAKIYYEFPGSYRPWSGAVDTWDIIEREGKIDDLENFLDEIYPDGIGETELNDLLWFDSEYVFESLGIKNPYDEDEDEEEEEEEEEDTPVSEEEYKGYDIYEWYEDDEEADPEKTYFTICKNDKYISTAADVEDAKRKIDEGF